MFTSRTARVAPPLRRCGRARPPNSAQARCGGSPLLRQGPPAGHGGTIMHPCHSPPIYIDTRNAQKVASILHFFKNFFVPRGDEDEIKEKADGGLPG